MLLLDPDDELSRVLTIPQAAELVGKQAATLRDWIRKRQLPVMRVGRRTYCTERAVLDCERDIWLRTHPETAPA